MMGTTTAGGQPETEAGAGAVTMVMAASPDISLRMWKRVGYAAEGRRNSSEP